MTVLLDANVLIALTIPSHVHHVAASSWFSADDFDFATCPITEGSLTRLIVRQGGSPAAAQALLRELSATPRHEFWHEGLSYADVRLDGVIGHRQVTDAYLAELSRVNHGRLATFDSGLAAAHQDVSVLVPVIRD